MVAKICLNRKGHFEQKSGGLTGKLTKRTNRYQTVFKWIINGNKIHKNTIYFGIYEGYQKVRALMP